MKSKILNFLVNLFPQAWCRKLWFWAEENGVRLGALAPHVLGRMLGVEPEYVEAVGRRV